MYGVICVLSTATLVCVATDAHKKPQLVHLNVFLCIDFTTIMITYS